jgi:hypothetical protein
MMPRMLAFALLGLTLAALGVGSAGDKKDAAKDKSDKAEYKSIAGVVKSVDTEKGSFTMAVPDSNDRTFLVNDSTKFVGPAGGSRGMGKAGLKDDTMVKGAEVRVVLTADNKAALEVHLPKRKPLDKAKDK